MDIPGPTTQAGTGTDYCVGLQDYSTFATWCKMTWSARQPEDYYSVRKLGMSEPMWSTPTCVQLVVLPQTDL
jgi:hypothetical protein